MKAITISLIAVVAFVAHVRAQAVVGVGSMKTHHWI